MGEKNYYNLHLYISGRVQGVGFRFFTINRARAYSITGWVKNLYDGRIEIEAEGYKETLFMFLEDMRIGSRLSHVSNVIEEWNEIAFNLYDSFTVRY